MNALIVKLGATGDVVRTTPLLSRLDGSTTWITAAKNTALLNGVDERLRVLSWEQREQVGDRNYDLVINLEDDLETGLFAKGIEAREFFGAYVNKENRMTYTDNSRAWFDLSLISAYGKEEADRLKAKNRRTYQELIFEGLGFRFEGERYLLPTAIPTPLKGDVAIAPEGGPVWPMKNWAYYAELQKALEAKGFTVNVLPLRSSLLEHLADVQNHRCLVSGDSLPMHMALGTQTRCVSLFTCTSPWEIYGYGVQTKIVSPLLEEFFYKRGVDRRATTAIGVNEVLDATLAELSKSGK